ncbi:MAG: hypothetical protein ACREQ1_07250, partial [Woeseiaceae bacterium]
STQTMSLEEEIEALRRHLDQLASCADDELIDRYELKRPPMPPGLYWRSRWLAGLILRWLRSMPIGRPNPWPVSLEQSAARANARPLLIWAVGGDRDTLRDACREFASLADALQGFAPVLVTDVADFAFFSRLGWLVEYLPRLTGQGEPYEARKMRFLARLYHGAPVLPLSAGSAPASRKDDIRRWLNTR